MLFCWQQYVKHVCMALLLEPPCFRRIWRVTDSFPVLCQGLFKPFHIRQVDDAKDRTWTALMQEMRALPLFSALWHAKGHAGKTPQAVFPFKTTQPRDKSVKQVVWEQGTFQVVEIARTRDCDCGCGVKMDFYSLTGENGDLICVAIVALCSC